MPAAEKSRRVAQCCYSEGGRKCRRSATGNPPLCNPHRIAVAQEMASQHARTPMSGAGVSDLIERLVMGRKINRKVVEAAIGDAADFWDKYKAHQAEQPPQPQQGRPWYDHLAQEAKRRAEQAAERVRRAQPPPIDPREQALKEKRQRARIVLGYAPSERPTEQQLKARRKELARQYHSDVTGSGNDRKMAEVNEAVDVLLAELVA